MRGSAGSIHWHHEFRQGVPKTSNKERKRTCEYRNRENAGFSWIHSLASQDQIRELCNFGGREGGGKNVFGAHGEAHFPFNIAGLPQAHCFKDYRLKDFLIAKDTS
ncbi:hypothetical protein J6590_038941 [Homalodisca vitripennis]|nr:hypothetical protein J6590_038941 [Homalodisca vitripennis]